MEQLQLFNFGNESFWKYHRDNPQIYEAFKQQTLRIIARGFKHSSADMVYHILRWETCVNGNDEYKLNNNYRSYYARLFAVDYPEHKEFFRFRDSKANSLLNQII